MLLDQKVVLEQDTTVEQTTGNSPLKTRSHPSKRSIENDGAYSYQEFPFVPELNFISQPPGTHLGQMANYRFPATAGDAIDVYVPDSGCNTANTEFVEMRGSYRWLQPPRGTWPGSEPWAPEDPTGHGTCIGDKVAGYDYGVAKNANIIFLRMPVDKDDDVFNSGMLLVFQMMADDIDARKAQGYTKLPVVTISWGTREPSPALRDLLFRAVSNLVDKGAVLIILSGNGAVRCPPHLPARLEII